MSIIESYSRHDYVSAMIRHLYEFRQCILLETSFAFYPIAVYNAEQVARNSAEHAIFK